MLLTAQNMWTYGRSNPSIKTSFPEFSLSLSIAQLAGVFTVFLTEKIWKISKMNILWLFFFRGRQKMFWRLFLLSHEMKTDSDQTNLKKKKEQEVEERMIKVGATCTQYYKTAAFREETKGNLCLCSLKNFLPTLVNIIPSYATHSCIQIWLSCHVILVTSYWGCTIRDSNIYSIIKCFSAQEIEWDYCSQLK